MVGAFGDETCKLYKEAEELGLKLIEKLKKMGK
jgi:hypothetical protein